MFEKIKAKVKALKPQLTAILPSAFVIASTSDLTDIITEWLHIIIIFAMLGMVLGLLKKFGKF
jgi:hypothetical protein